MMRQLSRRHRDIKPANRRHRDLKPGNIVQEPLARVADDALPPGADDAPARGLGDEEQARHREKVQRGKEMTRVLFRKIDKARNDSSEFFQFVMRNELTKQRIRTAAHQRLVLEFVAAHDRCVVRMPPGASKTYLMATLAVRQLGEDNRARCAAISSVASQAEKPVGLAKEVIENRGGTFPEIKLVYPDLQPGDPNYESWRSGEITVARPAGIRDPSFVAYGVGSKSLLGSRLSWILCDDILDGENTATKESCAKVNKWFFDTVLTRADVLEGKSRIIVTNTPWSKWDLTFHLERERRWPSLTLDCDGNAFIRNTDFDSDLIRPAHRHEDKAAHRLTAHDAKEYGAPLCLKESGRIRLAKENEQARADAFHYDFFEEVVLWPEVLSRKALDKIQESTSPIAYAKNYRMILTAEGEEAVPLEWVERCKSIARSVGHARVQNEYKGPGRVVHGCDIAIGEERQHDRSAIFSFVELPRIRLERPIKLADGRLISHLPRGTKKILKAQAGHWRGSELVDRIISTVDAFGGVIAVENNAAQDFVLQWGVDRRADLPVVPHTTTGVNKRDRNWGVESIFYMFRNGAWLIPNDGQREIDPYLAEWVEQCTGYVRGKHTGDLLMARWFGTELARSLDVEEEDDDATYLPAAYGFQQPSFSASINAR